MRQRPSILVAVVLVLALVAGCSGGSDKLTAKEQKLSDAFAKNLGSKDDGFGVTAKQGGCIGDAILHELGAKPFDEAKVTPAMIAKGGKSPGELLRKGAVTKDQAKTIAKGWQECVDLAAVFSKQVGGGFKLDKAGQECVAGKLRKGSILDDYLVVSFTSKDVKDAQTVLQKIVALVQVCSAKGGKGGLLVDSIATSLASDGQLTAEQARCVAQDVVDTIGADRLAANSDFSTASPEVKAEFSAAIAKAATACGVASTILGG